MIDALVTWNGPYATSFIGHVETTVDLEEALGAHSGRVYNYFRRMVPGRETAQDLSQETFLRAIRSAHRYRGESSVDAWLLGIARNVFREWLLARRSEPTEPPSQDREASRASEVDDRMDLERFLLRLAPEHREVLVLRFVLDLSGEETAAILAISHDAVRQRVVRAKAEFKALW